MTQHSEQLASDVAAASAAYIVLLMPELVTLPEPDLHARLQEHFETAIRAYFEFLTEGFPPDFSEN
jgi:hypothetical protein